MATPGTLPTLLSVIFCLPYLLQQLDEGVLLEHIDTHGCNEGLLLGLLRRQTCNEKQKGTGSTAREPTARMKGLTLAFSGVRPAAAAAPLPALPSTLWKALAPATLTRASAVYKHGKTGPPWTLTTTILLAILAILALHSVPSPYHPTPTQESGTRAHGTKGFLGQPPLPPLPSCPPLAPSPCYPTLTQAGGVHAHGIKCLLGLGLLSKGLRSRAATASQGEVLHQVH